MATEITIKILNTLDEVFSILNNKGFSLLGKFTLFDKYFSITNKNEIKNLDYQNLINTSLLIRTVEKNNIKSSMLIYKDKKFDTFGNVIDESKINIKIFEPENLETIFNKVGFNKWCDYEIINYIFSNNEFELLVQQVPNLGVFIEFEEYPKIKNKTEKEKFEILVKQINNLGLNFLNDYSCKKPYLFLHNTKQGKN